MIQVRQSKTRILLPVRVTPRGGKDCLLPFLDGDSTLNMKVSVPPEDGKANTAVLHLLAKVLGLPKSRIAIHSGDMSRYKQVSIALRDAQDVEILLARLGAALNADVQRVFVILEL